MSARELLKEATELKKLKEYDWACKSLRLAYVSADVDEYITLKDRLRLPMYLQLAGKNDEGWRELNILAEHTKNFRDQADINNQMKIFLRKEGNIKQSVIHGVYAFILEVIDKKQYIRNLEYSADHPKKINADDLDYELMILFDEGRDIHAYTINGSPIYDCSFKFIREDLYKMLDVPTMTKRFDKLLSGSKLKLSGAQLAIRVLYEIKYFSNNTLSSISKFCFANHIIPD
ncbi:hypothetical protein [Sodalis sp. RH16]|uniref:hypothetical protein n=1 Tax=Sodalis sp. RH16 TaxID=3394331 RepID=UPI0039B4ED3E